MHWNVKFWRLFGKVIRLRLWLNDAPKVKLWRLLGFQSQKVMFKKTCHRNNWDSGKNECMLATGLPKIEVEIALQLRSTVFLTRHVSVLVFCSHPSVCAWPLLRIGIKAFVLYMSKAVVPNMATGFHKQKPLQSFNLLTQVSFLATHTNFVCSPFSGFSSPLLLVVGILELFIHTIHEFRRWRRHGLERLKRS